MNRARKLSVHKLHIVILFLLHVLCSHYYAINGYYYILSSPILIFYYFV